MLLLPTRTSKIFSLPHASVKKIVSAPHVRASRQFWFLAGSIDDPSA